MYWFSKTELKYPVDYWKVNGVHIWPLIRTRIGYWVRNYNSPSQISNSTSGSRRISYFKRFYYNLIALCLFVKHILFVSKKKYLFIGAFSHREKVDNTFMNKFFDPIIESLSLSTPEIGIWEYGSFHFDKEYYNKKQILPLDAVKPFVKYFVGQGEQSSREELPEFAAFLSELESNGELAASKSEVHKAFKQAKKINEASISYEFMLRQTKPKLVIVLCYYSSEAYPIVLACKKLKIPCADFQHGPQGNVHFAYGNWDKIPYGGYNLLPDYFLTWDKDMPQTNSTDLKQSVFHRGICFGHPWVAYWKEKSSKSLMKDENKKKVLFSLQPIGELLTEEEIQMIKETQDLYQWLLRLHPRQLDQQNKLEWLLKDNDMEIEVEKATFSPLPSVLSSIDMHCTRSSGVVIEAFMFGVPSLLLSHEGVSYYPNQIETGSAFIPDSFDSRGFIKALAKMTVLPTIATGPSRPVNKSYKELLESIS